MVSGTCALSNSTIKWRLPNKKHFRTSYLYHTQYFSFLHKQKQNLWARYLFFFWSTFHSITITTNALYRNFNVMESWYQGIISIFGKNIQLLECGKFLGKWPLKGWNRSIIVKNSAYSISLCHYHHYNRESLGVVVNASEFKEGYLRFKTQRPPDF